MKHLPLPIWLVFRTNLIKTIIFNFRLLPFRQAWKLPIVLIGKVKITGNNGTVIIKEPVYTGMVIFGELTDEMCALKRKTGMRIKIEGKLYLEKHIHIRGGGVLLVSKNGVLSIGQDTNINCYSRIWCVKHISIGRNVRASWDSQIFDSNFHYLIDEDGNTRNCTGSVMIGNNVWIGNRSTINKGTVLPDFTIVGSGSFVNKDFTKYGEKCIVGGIPAKFIKSGYRRLFDRRMQTKVDAFFNSTPNAITYYVGNDVI